MEESEGSLPRAGRIRSVRGRNTAEPERGLPKISAIVVEDADGTAFEAALAPFPAGANLATAHGVAHIRGGHFEFCPICHNADADTLEHVPPKAFGGYPMTMTCARCNNDLGSRTESAMQDWFDGAIRVHYTAEGDPRPFGHDRAFLRPTKDGQFVIIAEKARKQGEGFREHFQPGAQGHLHVSEPRPAEYKAGLLKSAFLAASLHLRRVPDVVSAREIQVELLAARDAKRRCVALGPRAASLAAYRTGLPASGPTLALLRTDSGEYRYLLSLAGTVLVDWPFPEVEPVTVGP